MTWRVRHERALRGLSVIIPVLVVAVLLLGFSDLVPVSFSGVGVALPFGTTCYAGNACGYVGSVTLPSGPNVTVRWVDASDGTVTFRIGAPGESLLSATVCNQEGPNGTCRFTSIGGLYGFYAMSSNGGEPLQTVTYTGSYSTSLFG